MKRPESVLSESDRDVRFGLEQKFSRLRQSNSYDCAVEYMRRALDPGQQIEFSCIRDAVGELTERTATPIS
jgi:hypothetical protein